MILLKFPSPIRLENELDYLSKNFRQDDVYTMYSKEDIIHWLNNIL